MSTWLDPTTAAEAKRLIQKNAKATKTIQAELDQLNRGEHSTSFPEQARRDLEAQLASRVDADAHFKRHLERLSPGAKAPAPRAPRAPKKTKAQLDREIDEALAAGAIQGHHVQFQVPGGPWVWVSKKGTGTMDPREAHDFKSREAARHIAAVRGPGTNLGAKYVTRKRESEGPVGKTVQFEESGLGGHHSQQPVTMKLYGKVTRVMPSGDLEIRATQGGYYTKRPDEVVEIRT